MIPSTPEEPRETQGRSTVRPLTAAFMYERLQRMSNERGLKLAPEDILISAYLGHNLIYATAPPPATATDLHTASDGRTSPMSTRTP
uniref:Uncharacterized protein n=1 Tax=Anopheles aquasalis TaxID=42839 RepID=T1DEU2_ANOAQ